MTPRHPLSSGTPTPPYRDPRQVQPVLPSPSVQTQINELIVEVNRLKTRVDQLELDTRFVDAQLDDLGRSFSRLAVITVVEGVLVCVVVIAAVAWL